MRRIAQRSSVPSRRAAMLQLVSILALGALPAAADSDCRPVHGRFSATVSNDPGCTSPVGLCGTAEWKGALKADASFVASSIVPTVDTPATGVVVVTIDNHLVTADGDLFTKDAILLGPTGEFTEIDTVVGGTGDFAGATGSWIASGTFDGVTVEGSFAGELCLP